MSDTPQQSATPRTDAATYNGHACLKAECKALEIELSQAEAVIDRWAGQPGSFARCEKLETELATARRLLAEERQHTEDLKAHQAAQLQAKEQELVDDRAVHQGVIEDLRKRIAAKDQELAEAKDRLDGEQQHVMGYVAALNHARWKEFIAK